MEYIFGIKKDKEILKTKGTEHSDLKEWQRIEIKYSDCKISDSFYVESKYATKEDVEGNCYDWYYISQHNRMIDKSEVIKEQLQADIDYIAMETGIELEQEEV